MLRSREGFGSRLTHNFSFSSDSSVFMIALSYSISSGRLYCPRKGLGHEGSDPGVLGPARQGEGGRAVIDSPHLPLSVEDNPPEGIPGVREAGSLPGSSRHDPAVQIHQVPDQGLRTDSSHWNR